MEKFNEFVKIAEKAMKKNLRVAGGYGYARTHSFNQEIVKKKFTSRINVYNIFILLFHHF
jgi:hypothetical protein